MLISRFAPSPTGRLHFGHAFSAVRAHDIAREAGGRFLLRIEDIDGTRSREDFVAGIEEDLRWLGLTWDGPVMRQSARMDVYAAALDRLKALGLVYPCFCTRAEIAASASAPHGDEGPIYPGTCRPLSDAERESRAHEPLCWRLDMGKAIASAHSIAPATGHPAKYYFAGTPQAGAAGGGEKRLSQDPPEAPASAGATECAAVSPEGLWWHDATAGWIKADPARAGDVVLARKETPTSYHLAVTVDDAAQGVTDVVRGTDLFAATHVHRLLQALLGLPTPAYHHHPLLIGADGKRLAKRNGARPLAELRDGGADPSELLASLRAGTLPIGVGVSEA